MARLPSVPARQRANRLGAGERRVQTYPMKIASINAARRARTKTKGIPDMSPVARPSSSRIQFLSLRVTLDPTRNEFSLLHAVALHPAEKSRGGQARGSNGHANTFLGVYSTKLSRSSRTTPFSGREPPPPLSRIPS
jgi:hypothetical protein